VDSKSGVKGLFIYHKLVCIFGFLLFPEFGMIMNYICKMIETFKMKRAVILFIILILFSGNVNSQKIDDLEIKNQIAVFKNDLKGPYQQIMWFCPDGSKVPPQQRCPEKGGLQRATYKDWVESLAKKNHVFLGQILATTDYSAFLDEENQYSRLKQYQLEKFLIAIDNGWILRKARFYRGAFQDEDENEWGVKFLNWVLADKKLELTNFYLIKQTFKNIPHKTENSNIQKVRALSLEIAESNPKFMNLRIKIHGQPDISDLQQVIDFKSNNANQLSAEANAKLDELIRELELLYKSSDWQSLSSYVKLLGATSAHGKMLQSVLGELDKSTSAAQKIKLAAELLLEVRKSISSATAKSKFILLDLSNRLEENIFKELPNWEVQTLSDLIEKNYYLSMAAAGCGFIELWEWDKIAERIKPFAKDDISLAELNEYLINSRRIVEWSTSMILVNYADEIKTFEGFEPLVKGFTDDLIRSTILLQLGQSVGMLGDFINEKSELTNKVFNIKDQGGIRGINPGFSKGILQVEDSPEGLKIAADKIYVFQYPPSDLKPVAGIATVNEGNLVSHVQLLARNLGIPNSVLSLQNLAALKPFSGQEIFYAVTGKGNVLMKLAESMSREEKLLFEVKKRSENKIRVPVHKMDLKQSRVLNLNQVNASSSGEICGPKAANLGQLKLMFPENVVDGLVIPFGIFRKHMDQMMPNQQISYWDFLTVAFEEASQMERQKIPNEEINKFLLAKLEILRNAILKMPLMPAFVDDLKSQFNSIFGRPLGKLPVFLRSDTNMEDLKDFTGAGLNLTLFNVLDEEKILKGINQVWASPYSERSFQWRQSYLLNPENVYPSILIIPSVNVDYSGVLITKGVSMGDESDLTIAFSRGAGGAVDGQSAESYLLREDGQNILLAPSREPSYNMLPVEGGTYKQAATFENSILNEVNLHQIRNFAAVLKQKMKESQGMKEPFDVELGFLNNKLWLFQVRPFVENRNAAGVSYLESITPRIDESQVFILSEKIK